MNFPLLLKKEIETLVKKGSWAIHDHILCLIEHLVEITRKVKCVQALCESKFFIVAENILIFDLF